MKINNSTAKLNNLQQDKKAVLVLTDIYFTDTFGKYRKNKDKCSDHL